MESPKKAAEKELKSYVTDSGIYIEVMYKDWNYAVKVDA